MPWILRIASLIAVLAVATPGYASPGISTPHASSKASRAAQPGKALLLAHYMPWFQAKPFSPAWGYHWTMNHFDPNREVNGRRDAASHYYPLIGLYDSSDPDALECQALLMKMAGIDGVIIDWYGNDDYYDYAANNRNTEKLINVIRQAGLHFAICYEDQTVRNEIAGKQFPASDAVAHGQKLMRWMQSRFFSSPAYVKLQGRPILLSFGEPYYQDSDWNALFSVLPVKPLYFTESVVREPTAAVAGFDWPIPAGGTAQALKQQVDFYTRAKNWPLFIAAAFPRFHDIYQDAGVGKSLGIIDDDAGRTYEKSLARAIASGAPIVQLVTWNDWGEGTQIEPSVEFGYRDLETTQRLQRKLLTPNFLYTAQDLRLAVRWYLLRKQYASDPVASAKLAPFFSLINSGQLAKARALLGRY